MDLRFLKTKLRDYISANLADQFMNPILIELKKADFNQGMESTIYLIAMDFIKPGTEVGQTGNFVFKLYDGINSKILFDPNLSANSEYIFTNYLSRHEFPVPIIYAYEEENNAVSEFPFVLMNLIEGEPLTQYLQSLKMKGEFQLINRVWEQHAQKLAQLHSVEYISLTEHFRDAVKHNDPHHYLNHDLALWDSIIKQHSISAFFDPFLQWLNSKIGQIPLQKYSIVHRDIYEGNLLVDPHGTLIVIDWGVSYITDFRLDLGYTLMQINLDDKRTITRDAYLRLYENFGSIKVLKIEFFEVLALIKNLMIQTIITNHQSSLKEDFEVQSFIIETKSFNQLLKITESFFPDLFKLLTS